MLKSTLCSPSTETDLCSGRYPSILTSTRHFAGTGGTRTAHSPRASVTASAFFNLIPSLPAARAKRVDLGTRQSESGRTIDCAGNQSVGS